MALHAVFMSVKLGLSLLKERRMRAFGNRVRTKISIAEELHTFLYSSDIIFVIKSR
jgi:hypothetical protein